MSAIRASGGKIEDKTIVSKVVITLLPIYAIRVYTIQKERLVCKGYCKEEGIGYGETFALVARLEGVNTLLAYVAHRGFKVYQMDVKSAFLNGILDEEVYIEQP